MDIHWLTIDSRFFDIQFDLGFPSGHGPGQVQRPQGTHPGEVRAPAFGFSSGRGSDVLYDLQRLKDVVMLVKQCHKQPTEK